MSVGTSAGDRNPVRISPWTGFLLRRLASLMVVVAVLTFASFTMSRLIPGDPAVAIAGMEATTEQLALIRHELGLDVSIGGQLLSYLKKFSHGNLGESFQFREPVTQVIAVRIGPSLQLAAVSLAMVMLLSVPAGILAAIMSAGGSHRGREVAFTATTGLIGSLPEYLAATFLAFIFAVWLHLLPVGGNAGWVSLILPVVAITLRPIALLARIVRVETLNVLAEDYIRTARSKRLPSPLLYLRHVLPNVVTGALTIGGILFAHLIGGAVVVENVFARVGLGTALVNAILSRDYPVIQACILLLGITVVLVNAFVDIALAILDPRTLTKRV